MTVASGVEHAHVIDVIAHDPEGDRVTLVLIENRRWSDDDSQLFQLQEKLNAYVSFALDGEMAEAYPPFADKPVKLLLECMEPPSGRSLQLLSMVRDQIAYRGLELEVNVTGSVRQAVACGCQSGNCAEPG